eukprot:gnl/MRDRNA2_/MRDRNA2_28732_c0_seq1.p1 gnl/MRDRNA2_/MRDRNA2_28732_c0~~gnl/MRDRNA2_/MRDRNA2_28732_c0_seq1.p1  ORF type:complete len:264 (+),score=54.66 gnl/MRDRNA2_/MRDRNA2_28732_c0_seq1:58-849(+)
MVPRELAIGATAVAVQLLYSVCYPYLAPAGKNLVDLVDLSFLNQWFAGSESPNGRKPPNLDSTDEIEDVESAVRLRLQPHMDLLVQTFKNGEPLKFPTVDEIDVSFEVYQADEIFKVSGSSRQPWAYFFRVTVQNQAKRSYHLQSIARGYVLKMFGENIPVFPVSRMTEGPAAYILKPGDEYRYAWTFLTSKQVLEASGSLLFSSKDMTNGNDQTPPMQFLNATLGHVKPLDAPTISTESELKSLATGYNYMGTLDFRHVDYV